MAIADVEIFGGGIFGLAVAFSCARRGVSVRVVEKRRIGSGASGGILGTLAPHVPDNWNPKKQFQFESLTMAGTWWSDAEHHSGLACSYVRNGRFQPIADESAMRLAVERQKAARRNWGRAAEWQILKPESTWVPETETGYAVFDTLSAQIQPRNALHCLAEAVRRLGGDISEGCADSNGAAATVHATGFEGLLTLNSELGLTVGRGEKGQAALFVCDHADSAQVFAEGIHLVPHQDGNIAVGSTSERNHNGRTDTDQRLERLIEKSRHLFPRLRKVPVIGRWAGIRPRASSRAPLLGPYPGKPDHYIVNGGFKIGFGLAPKIGETMADLILLGRDNIPDAFLPPG
ncbi:MAG: FAD-binding oxidoreductase [Rhodobacteraceae bacterium]|nr:FAD-binding oxidoreductase [Paracoccaceae bacterium]